MRPYRHRVNYYETDKMGITHHANYIHWMEEARIDFLDQIGWGYDRLEALGVVSPVIAVQCQYKASTTFNDRVDVAVSVRGYRGPRLTIGYEMRKEDGTLVLTGESEHCFLDREGKFLRLAKVLPEFDEAPRAQAALGEKSGETK